MTRTITIRVDERTYQHIKELSERNGKTTIEGMAWRILDASRKMFEDMRKRNEVRVLPRVPLNMRSVIVPWPPRRPHEHDCGEPDCQPIKLGDGVTK